MAPRLPKASENGRVSPTSEDISNWTAERDEFVAEMRHRGAWSPLFGPLLDEFNEALRMAARLRVTAEEELFVKSSRSGRNYAHPAIALADVEVRRAALLLSRLFAMAKQIPAEDEPEEERGEDLKDELEDPFAELDATTDLTVGRRRRREGAKP